MQAAAKAWHKQSSGHESPPLHGDVDQRLHFRPLQPDDYEALRAAHEAMFPIDYEEAFFRRAVRSQDGIFSFAAIVRHSSGAGGGGGGGEELAGFITARLCALAECDPLDRTLLDLASRLLNAEKVVYILTLAVLEPWQGRGIATALLDRTIRAGAARRARAVYLHVIHYNAAAIAFYRRAGFEEMALLRDFYFIGSGRQLDPNQLHYDAYLYALQLDASLTVSPLAVLTATLWSPMRVLVSSWGDCIQWQPPHLGYCGMRAPASHDKPIGPSLWLRRLFARGDRRGD